MTLKDTLQDLNQLRSDISQNQTLAYHKKHIQVLWNHIERLESFMRLQDDGSVKIAVGDASLTLKKNGEISIKGRDITISGSGEVKIKGSKVAQN